METLEYAVIAGLIAVVAVTVYATGGQWRTNLEKAAWSYQRQLAVSTKGNAGKSGG